MPSVDVGSLVDKLEGYGFIVTERTEAAHLQHLADRAVAAIRADPNTPEDVKAYFRHAFRTVLI